LKLKQKLHIYQDPHHAAKNPKEFIQEIRFFIKCDEVEDRAHKYGDQIEDRIPIQDGQITDSLPVEKEMKQHKGKKSSAKCWKWKI
jgi:hypothetical protein